MMHTSTATATRAATSTCTASRVEAVLDLFLGDVAAFIVRGMPSQARAVDWLRDLRDVLLLEAVQRFQLKITWPGGAPVALDYEVSDDGRIRGSDGCGGFASHWIPATATVGLVVSWRKDAPKLTEARKLLEHRGWGPGSLLDAGTTAPDRALSRDGYGFNRRVIGDWKS